MRTFLLLGTALFTLAAGSGDADAFRLEGGKIVDCDADGAPNYLVAGSMLASDGCLRSPNGLYQLIVQDDGNLVIYRADAGKVTIDSKNAAWSSKTRGRGRRGTYLVMQGDGNLVLYNQNRKPIWSTRTYRRPARYLVLGDFGELVLYEQIRGYGPSYPKDARYGLWAGRSKWATGNPRDVVWRKNGTPMQAVGFELVRVDFDKQRTKISEVPSDAHGASITVDNCRGSKPATSQRQLTYEEGDSQSWGGSDTWQAGQTVGIELGNDASVVKGKTEFNWSRSSTVSWDNTSSRSTTQSITADLDVDPGYRQRVWVALRRQEIITPYVGRIIYRIGDREYWSRAEFNGEFVDRKSWDGQVIYGAPEACGTS